MPTYEYECQKCGHEFEREQRMSDPPVKTCPKCKGRRVTKLISRSSFVLKGGGWYKDGYADSKKAKSDTPTSKPETKSEGKSETKPSPTDGGKSESPSKSSKTGDKGSSKSAA